jgi:hypothetical protein
MALSQFVDGDGLYVWSTAANIEQLEKQISEKWRPLAVSCERENAPSGLHKMLASRAT